MYCRDCEAALIAAALQRTTDRYVAGCMSRAAWTDHMASLWGAATHAGLEHRVAALIDPLAQSRRNR